MKLTFLLTLILSMNAYAYNLQEILESLHTNNKTKSIQAKRDANILENSLITTYNAPHLGVSLSHAKDPVDEGIEYSIGISQEVSNPFSADEKASMSQNLSKAVAQETKHELHLIELDIASKYYTTCISKELSSKAKWLLDEQTQRVKHFEKAFEIGEISKKELLFNRLDLANLHKNSKVYKRVYAEDFASLQKSLDNIELDSISCLDLQKPLRKVDLRDINEHGELKTLEYKKSASQSLYKMNSALFQTITYELLFEQELDTKRYTLGVEIPLGGVTSYQERLKKQELAKISSYEFEKASMKKEIQNSSKNLLVKLETLYDELALLQEEILPLNAELLKLAKSAHTEGEGTIMEYLDASRSYSENVLNMLEIKKTYYQTLFALYRAADMEYGEYK
jgi:outer membrane protein TolC